MGNVTKSNGAVALGAHFTVGPTGLTVLGKPSFEQWGELCRQLRTVEVGIQWSLGDAVRFGEEHWSERASQILDSTEGFELNTLRVYSWISGQVPFENRRADLSFSHHMAVAALAPKSQRHWLKLAAAGDGADDQWTVSRLKAAIKHGSDLAPSAFYVVVVVDSEKKQQALIKELELKGLVCKAQERRTPKKQKELTS